MGYLLCGPDKMDGGSWTNRLYTERLFGAAMKMTDETVFFVLRFLKATPFVVFVFCFFMILFFVVFSYPVR